MELVLIGIRFCLLLILALVVIYDYELPVILNTKTNQLIIAILIIFTIIVIDEIIGFLLGIIFLVIYFKYYQKLFEKKGVENNELKQPFIIKDSFSTDVKPEPNTRMPRIENDYVKMDVKEGCVEMPYISTELLDKAQNNIYDINNYYQEIKITPEAYGIQGLNADMVHYQAFDKKDLFTNYK